MVTQSNAVLDLIRRLIRDNLAGEPINFVTQKWEFDPDVADRRRPEFESRYGMKGWKLIQHFGLGEDGFKQQRLEEQNARDEVLRRLPD